jgi:hypothetical protein
MTNTDEAEYLAAVKEGKAIVASISGKQWALGDLAARVEKAYGENRLEQFAEDINVIFSTLSRYRSVCLAFPKTGGRPRFFASAQILQTHPDRFAIVERNAAISTADAHTLMRVLAMQEEEDEADNDQKDTGTDPSALPAATNGNGDVNNVNSGENSAKENVNAAKTKKKKNSAKANANEEQQPDFRNVKGWHNDLVAAVNGYTDELNKVMARCTPEQWRLISELETDLLSEATQKLKEIADEFETFAGAGSFEEAAAERTRKARVRITKGPKPARRASGQQPKA